MSADRAISSIEALRNPERPNTGRAAARIRCYRALTEGDDIDDIALVYINCTFCQAGASLISRPLTRRGSAGGARFPLRRTGATVAADPEPACTNRRSSHLRSALFCSATKPPPPPRPAHSASRLQ